MSEIETIRVNGSDPPLPPLPPSVADLIPLDPRADTLAPLDPTHRAVKTPDAVDPAAVLPLQEQWANFLAGQRPEQPSPKRAWDSQATGLPEEMLDHHDLDDQAATGTAPPAAPVQEPGPTGLTMPPAEPRQTRARRAPPPSRPTRRLLAAVVVSALLGGTMLAVVLFVGIQIFSAVWERRDDLAGRVVAVEQAIFCTQGNQPIPIAVPEPGVAVTIQGVTFRIVPVPGSGSAQGEGVVHEY